MVLYLLHPSFRCESVITSSDPLLDEYNPTEHCAKENLGLWPSGTFDFACKVVLRHEKELQQFFRKLKFPRYLEYKYVLGFFYFIFYLKQLKQKKIILWSCGLGHFTKGNH